MKVPEKSYFLFAFAALVMVIVVAAVGCPSDPAKSQEPPKSQQSKGVERLIYSLRGPDLFRAHCAPCHGRDGKGNGPVAPALKDPLPDLTTIAHRNGGIYPEERVSKIITGDEVLIAHGSRDMPIWGLVFHQVENDRDYGNVRLHNVTEYVKSIQQK